MNRVLDWIAVGCGYLAGLFVLAMMGLTVADVVLRSFLNQPIHGVYELVELLLACTIFSALPAVFLRDENVVVDLVDHTWPRAVPVLRRVAAVVSFAVVAAMGWHMIPRAQDILEFGDVTSDLALPRIWYWIPVLVGVFAAAAAAFVTIFVREHRRR
jgi:TRAP-type C4-dicarboxylate transport system permease small subunit